MPQRKHTKNLTLGCRAGKEVLANNILMPLYYLANVARTHFFCNVKNERGIKFFFERKLRLKIDICSCLFSQELLL